MCTHRLIPHEGTTGSSRVSPCTRRSLAGFTVVELVVVIIVAVVLAGVLMPAFSSPRCRGSRQLKDATQIRNVVQSCLIWSQQNREVFPLPSLVDSSNTTVAEDGRGKDTSANIMSLLIWNGALSPEILVSPAESNSNIVYDNRYQNSNPSAAVDPAKALWDPGFSADFTNGRKANLSYAMHETSGTAKSGRLPLWKNTFSATEPVVGNRGPKIASVAYDAKGRATPTLADPNSNTLLIHGGRRTWEGYIGYNDGHVNYETSVAAPSELPYYTSLNGKRQDSFFCDEPDDATAVEASVLRPGRRGAVNMFMGIFTKIDGDGTSPEDFHAIWD